MSARGGSRGRGHRSRGYRHQEPSGKRHKTEENVDKTSPIIQAFLGFQKELDERNDRYERIVKLSRDITIESKRLIFLLQRVVGSDERESCLKEAAFKLQELHKSKFLPLAHELEGQDAFQFLRAFSPGLQEYIEAVAFYYYLRDENLVNIDQIQSSLTFTTSPADATSIQSSGEIMTDMSQQHQDSEKNHSLDVEKSSNNEKTLQAQGVNVGDGTTKDVHLTTKIVPIPPCEYMLGVADFTGELMRMAINSVGAGNLETPAVVTGMMRIIHDAFVTFNNTPREMRHKTRVLSQSLQKVERACYTLKVRGSEIPKHMLADVFIGGNASAQDTFIADDTDDMYD